MVKVVVSDLDGTLLNGEHRISSRTRDTLHKLVARGVKFVVATGRHHVDVQEIRNRLGLDIDLITANGAVVHDKNDSLIFNQTLPDAYAAEILAWIKSELPNGIQAHLYQGEEWLTDCPMASFADFHHESGFAPRIVDFQTLPFAPTQKYFFIGDHELLLPMAEAFRHRYGNQLNISFSLPDCLEVMHGSVNKGNAIKAVLEQNGFTLDQAMAFGDGMNDFEMLSMVGHGVVMHNAHSMLHEALPHLKRAEHAHQDGVARYLEQHFGL